MSALSISRPNADEVPIWGIHMAQHHGLEPVRQGYVAIGWHEMGDLAALPANRIAFKDRATRIFPHYPAGKIPGAAGVLYRFAVEMKPGDIIVLPSKPDRMINIGRIVGAYEYRPGHDEYPNVRKVEWLRSLPRTSFAQSALHEMGSAITLFRITTHADDIFAAIEGRQLDPQDADAADAEIVSAQVEESTDDFILKRLKYAQTPYQFEFFVAHLLKCMGYFARVTQASGDGGVDIIAHRDELGFEPPIIKVQCKQTLDTIGRPQVQQLHGAVESGEHGLFVTLGTFSADARTFERTKPNLRLLEGSGLIDLIYQHYHEFEPRYQMLLPMKRVYIPGPAIGDPEAG